MAACVACTAANHGNKTIYKGKHYTLTDIAVTQNGFTARALGPDEIVSDYHSPANLFHSAEITFKFAINGEDNELPSGMDHRLIVRPMDGSYVSPLLVFGTHHIDSSDASGVYLPPDSDVKLRVDLRHVHRAWDTAGYWINFAGDTLRKADFSGLYVAGSAKPLTWDFGSLRTHEDLRLGDEDGDGIYEVTLPMNRTSGKPEAPARWKLRADLSAFPRYHSDYLMPVALYNLALEELLHAIEPDSTFRTGKEWAGVWTRDISYSILLSLASLEPQVARYSLLRKVKDGKIVQDTGTGGSYPVSTDRIVWAMAAWEVYLHTGDGEWMADCYEIIANTLADDEKNAFNEATGLFRGESSFLDWREQTYPRWMEPADIYSSECLGTNAVFFRAYEIMAEMAGLLGREGEQVHYHRMAQRVKDGINAQLWMAEKGYYAQYRYGRTHPLLSPRAEALGNALAVLFGIADDARSKQAVRGMPVTEYGIPCIYPQIPGIPPYHNNGVWPFVQSFWSLAAARAGNGDALVQSMASVYRPAALFLTNKENFVAPTGDFVGTQINSDNMLWSLAGNIGTVHKAIFGMENTPEGLWLRPFVPEPLAGSHRLENYAYREAALDISLEGSGNRISSMTMNGEPMAEAFIPAGTKGPCRIHIVLEDEDGEAGGFHLVNHAFSPETPETAVANGKLAWNPVPGATTYTVYRDGTKWQETSDTEVSLAEGQAGEYSVVAGDAQGLESFASEPIGLYKERETSWVTFDEPVRTTPDGKPIVGELTVPSKGRYAVTVRYANGNGSIKTDSKCATRTLKVNGKWTGTLVFPQRGSGNWADYGFSNTLVVDLEPGRQQWSIAFEPQNRNMDGQVDEALVAGIRIRKIND